MLLHSKRIKLISLVIFFLQAIIFASVSYAKDVNLYDKPQNAAKIVGKVDIAQGIIPIFTQADGEWLKVGDPRNGNVGWVKANELGTTNSPTSFSFSQKVIVDSKGVARTYPIVRYGDANTTTTKEQQLLQEYSNQLLPPEPDPQKAQERAKQLEAIYQQQQKVLNNLTNTLTNIIVPPGQKVPGASAPATKPVAPVAKPVNPSNPTAPQ